MAFCSGCGGQIPEGASACPVCGRAVGAAGVAAAPAAAGGGLTDNVAGMLAYVTIIPAILFLVMEPYNRKRFVRFHSFQSIFFTVALIAISIALSIIGMIPVVGWMTFILWPVIWIGVFIVWVILLIKANQGLMFKLPFIGDLSEKQANATA